MIDGIGPLTAVLAVPICAAALLAILPGNRVAAFVNIIASLATFGAALAILLGDRPEPGRYLFIDDLNIVFIVLNTFVGLTTSVFSAGYITHELETGRLSPLRLRFYHGMYLLLLF
ncbi:MAG: hydrogenase 4 subunit F, partial [Amphiplicatus sp.]